MAFFEITVALFGTFWPCAWHFLIPTSWQPCSGLSPFSLLSEKTQNGKGFLFQKKESAVSDFLHWHWLYLIARHRQIAPAQLSRHLLSACPSRDGQPPRSVRRPPQDTQGRRRDRGRHLRRRLPGRRLVRLLQDVPRALPAPGGDARQASIRTGRL